MIELLILIWGLCVLGLIVSLMFGLAIIEIECDPKTHKWIFILLNLFIFIGLGTYLTLSVL